MARTHHDTVREMLASTADPAYSVDHRGLLSGWNRGAEKLLGQPRRKVVGKPCHEVVRGRDVFGNPYCEPHCPVLVLARRHEPVRHFQMDVVERDGAQLRVQCTVLVLPRRGADDVFSVIHLLRPVDRSRSYLTGTAEGRSGGPEPTVPARSQGPLTPRELEVLGHLAQGESTREMASILHISTSTVRKHVQNLMGKLGVGSRLAAVLTAYERHLL